MRAITTEQVNQLSVFLEKKPSIGISKKLAEAIINSMTVQGFLNDYARVANSGTDRGMHAKITFKQMLNDYDNNKADIMAWGEQYAAKFELASAAEWMADFHNQYKHTYTVAEIETALNLAPLANEVNGTQLTWENNVRLTHIGFLWYKIAECLCLQYAEYIEPHVPYNPNYI